MTLSGSGLTPAARRRDLRRLGDLCVALLVMADVDPWGYDLRQEITAMTQSDMDVDLINVSKTLRDAFEKGFAKGFEEGLAMGKDEKRREAIEEGRREAIEEMLRRFFMRRVGRPLTEQEQQALAARVRQNGADLGAIEDKVFSLEGEALAAWLLNSRSR